jgi:hypothetical protein
MADQPEREKILQMVSEGKLTAAEAMELLEAIGDPAAEPEPSVPLTGAVFPAGEPSPDMQRLRRFWQIPFFIALAFLLLIGLWLRSVYQASEGAITFGFICLWSLFMFAFLATALTFMSRRSAWLHVRVREKSGKRINISLPLPTRLARWGINLARNFVPQEQQGQLEMAAGFLQATEGELGGAGVEPLMIHVDDEDGDQVQIYLG